MAASVALRAESDLGLTYAVLSTPRTGSHLLCSALQRSFVAGLPLEYLNHVERSVLTRGQACSVTEYLAALVETSWELCDGVFGLKVTWRQLAEALNEELPTGGKDVYRDYWDMLLQAVPRVRVVRLTRVDRLRQAISYSRALQTAEWGRTGDSGPKGAAEFRFEEIAMLLDRIAEDESHIDRMLNAASVPVLTVTYEQLLNSYERTVVLVARHLRLRSKQGAVAAPITEMQADQTTAEWVDRFITEAGGSLPASATSPTRSSELHG